jgi:hypothetical protein
MILLVSLISSLCSAMPTRFWVLAIVRFSDTDGRALRGFKSAVSGLMAAATLIFSWTHTSMHFLNNRGTTVLGGGTTLA